MPQEPQLALFDDRSMHSALPLQMTSGDAHETVHKPLRQICPVPQAWPQEPQLCASVWKLAQAPAQIVVPVGQVHPPETQTSPGAQAVPQAPQFSGSMVTLTQHGVVPAVLHVPGGGGGGGGAARAGETPSANHPPRSPPRIKRRELGAATPRARLSNHKVATVMASPNVRASPRSGAPASGPVKFYERLIQIFLRGKKGRDDQA